MGALNFRPEWKTTANKITIVRILLIPVFVIALLAPWPDWLMSASMSPTDAALIESTIKPWVAAIVYAILSLTDGIDGYIARKRNQITTFGKFIDPIADKILVAAALLALIELGDLPSWPVLIIITREFLVSGCRMLAASEGVVIAAHMSGKVKTVLTLAAVLLFIIKRSAWVMSFPTDLYIAFYVFSWIVMGLALLMTIVSMFQYMGQAFSVPQSGADAAGVVGGSAAQGAQGDSDVQGESAAQGIAPTDAELYSLAEQVLSCAREAGVHLATAESCTGGMIGAALTAVPGSSDVLEGGVISYSYDFKRSALGVSSDSLAEYGAVSAQVASEMAEGARRAALGGFDDEHALSVAVTGVAGPGASESKPAGTVWFGVAGLGGADTCCESFGGGRDDVRRQTVRKALGLLLERL